MKNFLFLVIIASFFMSCANEINLVEEGEPFTVVHALFNIQDTAHYVRVERSFQDAKISPEELAKDPSSFYYDDITVKINRTGSIDREYTLTRVNAAGEGYPRDTGFFAHDPSYVYKFTPAAGEPLEAGDELTISITIDENEPITGIIPLLGGINLAKPIPNNDTKIGFLPDEDFRIRYFDDEKRVAIFDIEYEIFYEEKADQSTPFVEKSFKWTVARGIENDRENEGFSIDLQYKGPSNNFYFALQNNVAPATTEIRRLVAGQITATFGGEAILDFEEVVNANTGITSAQVIPVYTNLSEGRGLVSSVTSITSERFVIGEPTRAEVEINPITQPLNFQ